MAAQEHNLLQLDDIRSSGQGNILRGIATGMADVFDSVVHTGENIFSSIAHGFESTANSTTDVVKAVAFDIESILTFTDTGLPGFILYIIDLCIIIYLIYLWTQNRPLPPRLSTTQK